MKTQIITSEDAQRMLKADARVLRFGTTPNGKAWVTLRKGYNWRVDSSHDEFGYDYKPICYFKNTIAAARALENILTDKEADIECAQAAWEYRTMSANR